MNKQALLYNMALATLVKEADWRPQWLQNTTNYGLPAAMGAVGAAGGSLAGPFGTAAGGAGGAWLGNRLAKSMQAEADGNPPVNQVAQAPVAGGVPGHVQNLKDNLNVWQPGNMLKSWGEAGKR